MAARQAAPRQHSDRPRLFPEDPFPISQRSATTSTGLGQGLGSPPQEFSISEGARHHRTFRPRWRGLHASIQAANVLGLPGRAGVRWSSPRGSPARAIRSSAWARRSPRRRRGLSVGSGEAQPGRAGGPPAEVGPDEGLAPRSWAARITSGAAQSAAGVRRGGVLRPTGPVESPHSPSADRPTTHAPRRANAGYPSTGSWQRRLVC